MDLKKISLYVQAFFYIVAGLNHFINPEFYYPLIPEYFVFVERINMMAGILEVALGIGLIIPLLRSLSAIGIIMILLAFVPSHIYFIQIGSCVDQGLCVPEWIGWLRLIIVHPLLIWWAWSVRGAGKSFIKEDFEKIGEKIINSEELNPNHHD